MALDLECPGCKAELRAVEALLEKTVRCPKCLALIYLCSTEKPLPQLCDMEQGPEPFVVSARTVVAEPSEANVNATPPENVLPGSETGGIGAPWIEGRR